MTITAAEQLMVELINRARLDPAAEAARSGVGVNEGVAEVHPGTVLSEQPMQPLAINPLINDAAEVHSLWMIEHDLFQHTGAGGSSAGDRMEDAGYVFSGTWSWAENLAVSGASGGVDLEAVIPSQHFGLWESPGHRINTLDPDFREIGIAQIEGLRTFPGGTFPSSWITLNFGQSGSDLFITGVAYDDLDGNEFYSVGEGRSGVSFGLATHSTQTAAAGGYALATTAQGPVNVSIGSGAMAAQVSVVMAGQNVKLDLVGDTVMSSATTTLV
ncbi:MAG: CAP domain-containing protein, partial [Rhodobacteraceae bacterium]|nr:CAP domain-containing protein [Paracoccaceae bacterium]